VPTVRHSRTLAASPERLWEVVGDPHHLPRWWPRVARVEDVRDGAFTEVLVGAKGKRLRADFRLIELEPQRRAVWAQDIEGTPFARVLKSAETEIGLFEHGGATEVRIELRQSLRGLLARLGSPIVRRAASATIQEAFEGLERAVVG
jgi:uncharacterized protein YndB with AHSA1/START domain